MKSLINGLLCASLMVFAFGCGKDGGKSGGSATGWTTNGLSTTSSNVMQTLTNWYNGTVEGYPQVGQVNTTKRIRTYNTQPSCESKKFIGIPYTLCSYNGSPSESSSAFQVNVLASSAAIKNKGNAELNAIFAGSLGRVIDAIQVGASQYQLTILRTDGTVVIYGINTQRNSALNPEYKSETNQTQKIETQIL